MKTLIPYDLRKTHESFSSPQGNIEIELAVVADLDATIDQIYEKIGDDPFAEDLCPYFGVVWPSAKALAEQVAKTGRLMEGARVLEIGCGLALPSLVAAKIGAVVLATDAHPDVPYFLEINAATNSVRVEYKKVHWAEPDVSLGKFDFILASDVLYENTHAERVAQTLASYSGKNTHIFLTDPGRVYLQSFVDAMTKHGFRHDLMTKIIGDKEIFVFSFMRS